MLLYDITINNNINIVSIFRKVKHLIEQVKQLNNYELNIGTDYSQTENAVDHFASLSVGAAQPIYQQPVPVWPTMLQPQNNYNPHFNSNLFSVFGWSTKS